MTDPHDPTHGDPATTTPAAAASPAATEPTDAVSAPAEAATGPTEGAAPEDVDVGRRRFFRQFAGEVFQGAATVVGAAQALQRASVEAASAILDPGSVDLDKPAGATAGAVAATTTAGAAPGPPTGFRTPFREADGAVYLIDQRQLPDALVEV